MNLTITGSLPLAQSANFTNQETCQEFNHLLLWLASSCPNSQLISSEHSIEATYNLSTLFQILHQLCPDVFRAHQNTQISSLEELFIEYFYMQYGLYIGLAIRQQMIDRRILLLRFMLYACIYSGCRQNFVNRILRLPQKIQQKIVNEVEKVEVELKQMRSWDRLVIAVRKLQDENSQLKRLLKRKDEDAEYNQQHMKNLKQELQEMKNEANSLIVEKRRILGNFPLSSLAEYQDLCHKLTDQNEHYHLKEVKYLQIIKTLEQQVSSLQNALKVSEENFFQLSSAHTSVLRQNEQISKKFSFLQQSWNESIIRFDDNRLILKNSHYSQSTQDMSRNKIENESIPYEQLIQSKIFKSSMSSNISRQLNMGGSSSAWNMFRSTKNNIILNEKIAKYEQEIECLKGKIGELQDQVVTFEEKEKYYMKLIRRMRKLYDEFKKEYQSAKQASKYSFETKVDI